jgi:signal transduction histidine kinase
VSESGDQASCDEGDTADRASIRVGARLTLVNGQAAPPHDLQAQLAAALRRAEALARANTAMRRSVAALATGLDLDAFLGEVLNVCVGALDAAEGGVWLYDAATDTSRLVLNHDGSGAAPAAGSPHPGRLGTPVGHGDSTQQDMLRRRVVFETLAVFEASEDPIKRSFIDYLKSRNLSAVAMAPMFVGDAYQGTLTLRFKGDRTFAPEDEELAHALANQAALAVHTQRLADQAREAAVAREREAAAKARAEKLAAANALLRESAERLGAVEDIDAFLGQVLLTVHRLLGGHSASSWLYDWEGQTASLQHVIEDGRVVPAARASHPNANRPNPLSEVAGRVSRSFGTAAASPIQHAVAVENGFRAEQVSYLQGLGVRSLVVVPLVIGNSHLGDLTVRLTDDTPLLEENRELIQALANQAAVALHLTRLAEDARTAAVAREREAAAKARADKLAAANALLRESAERLGAVEDIDAFLGQVLLTITQLVDAASSSVWVNDLASGCSHLRYVVENGVAVPAASSRHPNATTPVRSADTALAVSAAWGTAAAGPTLAPTATNPSLTEEQRTYLLSVGAVALLGVPMVLNEQHLGDFTIRMSVERDLLGEDRELIQALANQAAVALHLTRLAEQAREAAVAREREEQAAKRAEALARIGEAGRSTLQRLSEKPDIDGFLGHVLTVCAEQFGAVGGGVWLWSGDGLGLSLVLEEGSIRNAEQSTHPARDQACVEDLRGGAAYQQRGRILIDRRAEFERLPDFRPYRDYLGAHGVRQIVSIPMFFGEDYRGSLTLRFTEERALAPEEEELAHALANQAVLALELSRLAEDAREAAVAREQEAAAREKAAALERIGQAARASLDRLAAEPDLDAFLAEVLKTAARELRAEGGGIWRAEGSQSWLHLSLDSAHPEPTRFSDHPGHHCIGALLDPPTLAAAQSATATQRRGQIDVIDASRIADDPAMAPYRDYMAAHGIRMILSAPILIGERYLGSLTLRFGEERWLAAEEEELAHVLASQAALALNMAELADRSRAAAVANARADELARANAALRGALEALSSHAGGAAVIAEVLAACRDRSGAHSANVWLYDVPNGVARVYGTLSDSGYVPGAEAGNPWDGRPIPLHAAVPNLEALVATRRPQWIAVDPEAGLMGEAHAYLRRIGVRWLAVVPMMFGAEIIGAINLRFDDTADPPALKRQMELAQALAHQAALALHLERLAGEAQAAAVLEERNRLAREIHDTLAQGFASVRVQLALAGRAKPGTKQATDALELAHRIASDNLVEARRSMAILRTDQPSLPDAIAAIVDGVTRLGGPPVRTVIDPRLGPVPGEIVHELSRITSEALLNATRHAEARALSLTADALPGGVRIAVTDDGKGFDLAHIAPGFGLGGLRERCAAIGAELSIVSAPGEGTEVIVTWTGDGAAKEGEQDR